MSPLLIVTTHHACFSEVHFKGGGQLSNITECLWCQRASLILCIHITVCTDNLCVHIDIACTSEMERDRALCMPQVQLYPLKHSQVKSWSRFSNFSSYLSSLQSCRFTLNYYAHFTELLEENEEEPDSPPCLCCILFTRGKIKYNCLTF